MRTLLSRQPDMTLEELRAALALSCTLPAIHYALAKLGLTYKKDAPGQRTGPTGHRAGPPGLAPAAGGLGPGAADLRR